MRFVTSFPRGALRGELIEEPSEFYASCAWLSSAISNPREATLGKTAKKAAPHHHQRRNKRERLPKCGGEEAWWSIVLKKGSIVHLWASCRVDT